MKHRMKRWAVNKLVILQRMRLKNHPISVRPVTAIRLWHWRRHAAFHFLTARRRPVLQQNMSNGSHHHISSSILQLLAFLKIYETTTTPRRVIGRHVKPARLLCQLLLTTTMKQLRQVTNVPHKLFFLGKLLLDDYTTLNHQWNLLQPTLKTSKSMMCVSTTATVLQQTCTARSHQSRSGLANTIVDLCSSKTRLMIVIVSRYSTVPGLQQQQW